MSDKEFYEKTWENTPMSKNGCGILLFAGIIVSLLLLFCSCASKKQIEYIDREVVKYKNIVTHDTLINNVRDSIRIEQKGDTVFYDRWHTVYREKISIKHDTCWRDSVRTEYKKETVEKKTIPKWCYISLALSIIFITFAIYKLIRWLR